jgi:uncharacterized protein YgfB (UPF0149 family)
MSVLELLKLGIQERNKRLQELIGEFNISHIAHQKAFTLSGGEFDSETEEDEQDYMEVYEFVRLAIIHLFEEMSPREEHRPQHEQLH